MDMRVGNNTKPMVPQRTTGTRKAENSSFADTLQKTEKTSAAKDTASISQNPLDKRLENVHKVIEGMDFTGKSATEVYRNILEVYENEFGNLDRFYYEHKSLFEHNAGKIHEHMEAVLQKKLPPYHCENPVFEYSSADPYANLHYEAMGYDKMTKAERIAAIEKRIGGSGYTDRLVMLGEMSRANIIPKGQLLDISTSLRRKMEKEYCKAHGLDYLKWQEDVRRSSDQNGNSLLYQRMMDWANQQKISWIDIIDSIKENEALRPEQQDELVENLEDALGLPQKTE